MAKKIGLPSENSLGSTQYASTQLYSSTRSAEQSSTASYRRNFLANSASIGGGALQTYLSDHVGRMHGEIEATTRKLELEQRRLHRIDSELEVAEAEYKQKREKHKLNSNDHPLQQKINDKKKLQRKLEKAISVLNKSSAENTRLREKIDQLRKERQIFDRVFNQLRKGIDGSMKTIERVKTESNEERLMSEDSQQKISALGRLLDSERRAFHADFQDLKKDIMDRAIAQRRQEAQKQHDEASKNKQKKTYVVADEEEAFCEHTIKMRILKLSFLNTIQRRHIRQHQKNIEVFEQAFATIKSTTGIRDVEEIVKIFIELEQRNFSLLTYVNTLNREIESIEIRNRNLQKQLTDFKEEQAKGETKKDEALVDMRQQIAKTEASTEEKDRLIEDSVSALAECRPLIWDIVKLIKGWMPDLVQQCYEGEGPITKKAPPDEHAEDLNTYLMFIEEAYTQFRVALQQEKIGQAVPPPRQVTSGRRPAANDLPVAHIAPGDDTDDETDNPMGERPLNRSELKSSALAKVSRRRKKGGQGGAQSTQAQPTMGSVKTPSTLVADGDRTRVMGGDHASGAGASEEDEPAAFRREASSGVGGPPVRLEPAASTASAASRESAAGGGEGVRGSRISST